jgi:hypothetical protein
MAINGITPNFQQLAQQNVALSCEQREHASTHFLTRLPEYLAEDAASHSEILVLENDGTYQPHRIVRLPLGIENHGYLLFPLDKNNAHIKAVFRGNDKFEQHGNVMDSFGLVEAATLTCLKDAIDAHCSQHSDGLTFSIYGNRYEKSSSQFFRRALEKSFANSATFDAIKCVNFNVIDSLKEQDKPAIVVKGTCPAINNKPTVFNFGYFSKISQNVIQQAAYNHIFKPTEATLEQIAAKNAELPADVREYAANHQLSRLSYALSKKGLFHENEVDVLTEDGSYQKYQVKQLPLVMGMYGYLFLPKDINDLNIRISFRGTDFSNLDSALINTEFNGPGSSSLPSVKDAMMAFIKSTVRQHYGARVKDLKLNVTGHSQGASLSQIFTTAFLKERANTTDFDMINQLTLTTFNDPGVCKTTRVEADALVDRQRELGKPMSIRGNFGYIRGDAVQCTCDDMIFIRLPREKVALSMMTIDNELHYRNLGARHYLSNFLSTGSNAKDLPSMIQINNNNMTFTNETPEEHEIILTQLLFKMKKTIHTLLVTFHAGSHLYRATSACANMMPFSLQDYCFLAFGPTGYAGFEVAKQAVGAFCRGELRLEPRAVLNQFKRMVGGWAINQTLGLSRQQETEEDITQDICLDRKKP